jgi:MoxR-like ATPase
MPDATSGGSERQLFTGSATRRAEPDLPPPLEPALRSTGHYIPGEALTHAVEVALILGQPLLLTGEPGTGKTTLAAALAHELFGGRFLEMQVKSDSGREDLLYRIDEMGIFRDSQRGQERHRLLDYLLIRPLGEAILRACPPDTKLRDRAGGELMGTELLLDEVFGAKRSHAIPTVADLLPERRLKAPERVVVLIDEIDKAPRDTPNDLLEEFDRMAFAVPEFNVSVRPPENAPRPVIIVTSNSEKSLPDAFLRRCAYHHIRFPDEPELRRIIASRLGVLPFEPSRLTALLALFERMRAIMQRPPGTAELLQWLRLSADRPELGPKATVQEMRSALKRLISAIAKNQTDTDAITRVIDEWTPGR